MGHASRAGTASVFYKNTPRHHIRLIRGHLKPEDPLCCLFLSTEKPPSTRSALSSGECMCAGESTLMNAHNLTCAYLRSHLILCHSRGFSILLEQAPVERTLRRWWVFPAQLLSCEDEQLEHPPQSAPPFHPVRLPSSSAVLSFHRHRSSPSRMNLLSR